MRRKILILTIVTIFTTTMASAKAKIPVCFPCETIETIKELPDDFELNEMANDKVNIAYINNEYGILWMSIWNTGGRYVLSNESNSIYYEIDTEVTQILKEKYNFDIATAENPLSFWKKIGGKLVLLVIVLLLIWGNIGSKKEKEIEPTNI